MNEVVLQSFLDELTEDPNDAVTRNIFADWLEDQPDNPYPTWSEALRLGTELHHNDYTKIIIGCFSERISVALSGLLRDNSTMRDSHFSNKTKFQSLHISKTLHKLNREAGEAIRIQFYHGLPTRWWFPHHQMWLEAGKELIKHLPIQYICFGNRCPRFGDLILWSNWSLERQEDDRTELPSVWVENLKYANQKNQMTGYEEPERSHINWEYNDTNKNTYTEEELQAIINLAWEDCSQAAILWARQ